MASLSVHRNAELYAFNRTGLICVRCDEGSEKTFNFSSSFTVSIQFFDATGCENSRNDSLPLFSSIKTEVPESEGTDFDDPTLTVSFAKDSFFNQPEKISLGPGTFGISSDNSYCKGGNPSHLNDDPVREEDLSVKHKKNIIPTISTPLKESNRRKRPCEKCNKVFQNTLESKLHSCERTESVNVEEERPDGQFICSLCCATFTRRRAFAAHKTANGCRGRFSEENVDTQLSETIQEENSFVDFETQSQNIPKTCKITKRPEKKQKEKDKMCDFCNKCYTTVKSLRKHIEKCHADSVSFTCVKCDLDFRSAREITDHEKMHRKEKTTTCKVCDVVFESEKKMMEHFKSSHKPFHCELCKVEFELQGQRQFHLSDHHGEDVDEEGVKIVKACSFCSYLFITQELLERHVSNVHFANKKLMCSFCGNMFRTQDGLTKHVRKCHYSQGPRMKYPCPMCHKIFCHKYDMTKHVELYHKGIKKYTCNICSKGFSVPYRLRRHMRTHSQETPHVCEVCQKGFRDIYNLNVHMRTHTGVKPFSCLYCNKAFSHKCSLEGHVRSVHKDEKEFRCIECGVTFDNRTSLKNHVTETHVKDV